MPDKRAHVYYEGLVQGVGFRITAERFAFSLGLKGWARNLGDGRVEIAAEGSERALKEFLRKLDSVFKSYIRDTVIDWSQANGGFTGFDIR